MGRAIPSIRSALLVAALSYGCGAFAAPMSKSDYSVQKDQIGADYKAEKAACDKFSSNEKDVCVAKAKGKEKVAKAELEYNYSGKPRDAERVAMAKGDAAYDVAKEMCDDKTGNAKDVCVREAKAAHAKAKADAKMNKKISDARQDAADDKRDADYKVAVEKCDSLSGDAKTNCISAAKARYGKS